jgi:hypothetical protein
LESLGFEWGVCNTTWEDRLRELADYRNIHGHCNVPKNYSENTQLGKWVALKSLGFERALEWDSPRTSDATKYHNLQRNHLRDGVDGESTARKKKG